MTKYIVGVDEAGRGPLAGPVSVGMVVVPQDFDWSLIPGVNDSKQLSEVKREAIYTLAYQLRKKGIIQWSVSLGSAAEIDVNGIAVVIRRNIGRLCSRLRLSPQLVSIKLDGSLKAPERFVDQETIIKGDAKEQVIGLASVLAKVTRDRYMVRLAQQGTYNIYDFDVHKGYGTKAHRALIKKHGVSDQHRRSFCKNCL